MHEDFCIRLRFEFVPEPRQSLANFTVVVDFAVHCHGDVSPFIPDRLMSTLKINNAQPPHPQRQSRRSRIVHQKSLIIWPAVPHSRGHPSRSRLSFGASREKSDAADSAHFIV